MKQQIIFIAIGLWFNMAIAQQANDQHIIAEFDKLLSEQFKADETGATALVARHGRIIYNKAFGMANLELNVPMKPDNVFRIASITKQFTAVAILQLAEQAKLNLQDEITLFIPDYPTEGKRITIEHLLTHTSGIQDFTRIKSPDAQRGRLDFSPVEMIDYFKNEPMRFDPGTHWEYSNSGYFLLGYIIEKVTGKTYREYLEENFFKPLGMSNSLYADDIKLVENRAYGYTMSENGVENAPNLSMTQPFSAGAIQSTVEDLFKWQMAVQAGKVIKKEFLDKAWSGYLLADGNKANYGYGWRLGYIQGSPSVWHGGLINGFTTMAMYLPDEDVFVAVFSNCDCNSPKDITAKLAAISIGRPYAYQPITLDNAVLHAYQGVYVNGSGQQRIITVTDNRLYSRLGRGPKFEAKPYQMDKFYFEDNPFLSMDFTRNAQKEITSFISRSREEEVVWMKTNQSIPDDEELRLDRRILEKYVGVYEIAPEFNMAVTNEEDRIFLQATGQEKLQMFANNETTFFLKVNDATIEFVMDESGEVTKAKLNQGGRQIEAKKIK